MTIVKFITALFVTCISCNVSADQCYKFPALPVTIDDIDYEVSTRAMVNELLHGVADKAKSAIDSHDKYSVGTNDDKYADMAIREFKRWNDVQYIECFVSAIKPDDTIFKYTVTNNSEVCESEWESGFLIVREGRIVDFIVAEGLRCESH